MNVAQFLAELKRRKVYKVAAAYAVIAWLVIQAGDILLPAFEAPQWVLKALITAVAIGFPVAIMLSWAFDLTPEGVVRTGTSSSMTKPSRHTGRKLTASIFAGALIGLALTLFQNFRGESLRRAESESKSIAVLPFVNSSDDQSQEYFSDGVTEELITGLTQVRELRVIGRSSSFRFKASQASPREVGAALGVGNLLEGTVRRVGDRVRISVSLVNAADGTQRWSETYDRELKDIFAVQEEIARSVADKLRVALLGEIKAPAAPSDQNLEAYNAFLQGQFEFARFNVESTRRAIEHYREAVRLDPEYARAYGELAWSYCRLGFFTGAAGREAFMQGREAAEMALKLGPDVAAAYSALAYIHMNLDWNLRATEAVLARATQSAPRDPRIKNTLAILRTYQNRPEEALVLRREAVALDPLDVILQGNLATVLTMLSRYDEAEAAARRALELQPNSSLNHYQIARIHLLRSNPDAALREAQAESGEIYRNLGIALAQTARGDRAAADEALATMIRRHGEDNPFRVALIYAFRGEADKVFEWLDRAYEARDPRVINTTSEDLLKPYRSDPRFVEFCRKVGF